MCRGTGSLPTRDHRPRSRDKPPEPPARASALEGAGIFGGGGSVAITVFPAVLAAVLAAAVLSLALLPDDIEQRLARFATATRAFGRLARRLAKAPDTLGSGVRTARGLVRDRRLGLLGAMAYWGFGIAVLGVCFDAFGRVVPVAVLVMGYFLAREPASTPRWRWRGRGRNDRRVRRLTREQRRSRAVLAYRAISFWLPALPGIAGYLALRSTVRGWRAADGSRCVERGHRLRGMRKTSS
jgi:hypothetical protein